MKIKPATLLVTNPTNIRYLTGFTGSSAVVLWKSPRSAQRSDPLSKEGVMGEVVLFTDPRYTERAAREKKRGVQVQIQQKRSDELLKKQLQAWRVKNLGFEATHLTVAGLANLKRRLRGLGLKFTPTTGEVEQLRRVKTATEIKHIAAACALADAALEATVCQMKRGITEREVAEIFRAEGVRRGAEDLSFDSIVAFGENTSTPHAKPGDRRLKKGDVVQFDIGFTVDGYHSDMSRVFFTAKPTAEQQKMWDAVSASQLAGVKKIRAGVVCGDVDATCRAVLAEYDLAEYFTHSSGHGVGLDIHEWPNNSPQSVDVLQPGHAVTVEPGVYVPGCCGMRIEDIVLVQKNGGKILTRFPKDLRILKI